MGYMLDNKTMIFNWMNYRNTLEFRGIMVEMHNSQIDFRVN